MTTNGTTQNRSHNARNQITAISGTTATPTYDPNGNLTQDETGKKYVYDAWDRIVTVKDAGNATLESYTYDAMGRRITVTDAGTSTTTDLFYDGTNVIEERQGSTVTAQYVWGLGYVNDLVLRDDNSTSGSYGKTSSGLGRRLYAQQDANFNVTSLVDDSGSVVQRFVYDPYGAKTTLDGSWAAVTTDTVKMAYGFQDGRQDAVTGLVHFGTPGRDYSPTLGAWGQADRAGYVDGSNLYQFVGGNPVDLVDPSGFGREYRDPSDPYGNDAYFNRQPLHGHGTAQNPDGVANFNNNMQYYRDRARDAANNQARNLKDLAWETLRLAIEQALSAINIPQLGFDVTKLCPVKGFLDELTDGVTNPHAKDAAPVILFLLGALRGAGKTAARAEAAAAEEEAAATQAGTKEGIYEFPDQRAKGKPYVGQSKDVPRRLDQHEAAGRLSRGTENTTPVPGGKTAREVAEHQRIQELTGGKKAGNSSAVSNERDPIGPNRRPNLGLPHPND